MKNFNAIFAFSNNIDSPGNLSINSTGAATQDGSEFIAEGFNNMLWGPIQAAMEYAAGGTNTSLSGTPGIFDGVVDAAGASQFLEALQKGVGAGPGKGVLWWLDDDPSVRGDRVLLLQGQGVLVSTYPDLNEACWIGGNDAAQAAMKAAGGKFWRSDDAAGTTGLAAGPYLQLPQSEGYTLRGLDLAAAVDPDGAGRFVGDNQVDAMQGHKHQLSVTGNNASNTANFISHSDTQLNTLVSVTTSPITDGINGTPRVGPETRMQNLSVRFGITY